MITHDTIIACFNSDDILNRLEHRCSPVVVVVVGVGDIDGCRCCYPPYRKHLGRAEPAPPREKSTPAPNVRPPPLPPPTPGSSFIMGAGNNTNTNLTL